MNVIMTIGDEDWSNKKIYEVLKMNFCYGEGETTYLGSIVDDLKYEFKIMGESYFVNRNYIQRQVLQIFQESQQTKHKKRGYPWKIMY